MAGKKCFVCGKVVLGVCGGWSGGTLAVVCVWGAGEEIAVAGRVLLVLAGAYCVAGLSFAVAGYECFLWLLKFW